MNIISFGYKSINRGAKMKTLLLIVLFAAVIFPQNNLTQQDTLIYRTGKTIIGETKLIKETAIDFHNIQDGLTYEIKKSSIAKIILKNGKEIIFQIQEIPIKEENNKWDSWRRNSTLTQESNYESQHNPDGTSPSIHISPFLSWGSLIHEYDKVIFGESEYPSKLGVNISVKFPFSRTTTISFLYGYEDKAYIYKPKNNNSVTSLAEEGNGSNHYLGATFSLYLD